MKLFICFLFFTIILNPLSHAGDERGNGQLVIKLKDGSLVPYEVAIHIKSEEFRGYLQIPDDRKEKSEFKNWLLYLCKVSKVFCSEVEALASRSRFIYVNDVQGFRIEDYPPEVYGYPNEKAEKVAINFDGKIYISTDSMKKISDLYESKGFVLLHEIFHDYFEYLSLRSRLNVGKVLIDGYSGRIDIEEVYIRLALEGVDFWKRESFSKKDQFLEFVKSELLPEDIHLTENIFRNYEYIMRIHRSNSSFSSLIRNFSQIVELSNIYHDIQLEVGNLPNPFNKMKLHDLKYYIDDGLFGPHVYGFSSQYTDKSTSYLFLQRFLELTDRLHRDALENCNPINFERLRKINPLYFLFEKQVDGSWQLPSEYYYTYLNSNFESYSTSKPVREANQKMREIYQAHYDYIDSIRVCEKL